MKRLIIISLVWLSFTVASAQIITEKTINFAGKEAINLKIQIADSINIVTWTKNEVYIKASVSINDNKDNEAYETSFSDKDNFVTVTGSFKENYFKGKDNCCNESDIYWQVYIPENSKILVETINADITIKGQTGEMKVKSISGYIDLAVPSSKKADLKLSTISGRMYSDHKLSHEKVHSSIPYKIEEKLNNGGTPIQLETISGDIYFRKSR